MNENVLGLSMSGKYKLDLVRGNTHSEGKGLHSLTVPAQRHLVGMVVTSNESEAVVLGRGRVL